MRPLRTACTEFHSGSVATARWKPGSSARMMSGFQRQTRSIDTLLSPPVPAAAATLVAPTRSRTLQVDGARKIGLQAVAAPAVVTRAGARPAAMEAIRAVSPLSVSVGIAGELLGTGRHAQHLTQQAVDLGRLAERAVQQHIGILVCSCTLLASETKVAPTLPASMIKSGLNFSTDSRLAVPPRPVSRPYSGRSRTLCRRNSFLGRARRPHPAHHLLRRKRRAGSSAAARLPQRARSAGVSPPGVPPSQ